MWPENSGSDQYAERRDHRSRLVRRGEEYVPLFNFYIIVDWSGGARRNGGRADTIWIAHGPATADAPRTSSPFSRTEAINFIQSLLMEESGSGRRVLVCFDFAYGYQ